MKLISVIVPLYNSAIYMKKCIDSILKQTYKNLELILIDDGSTDETCLICEHYCNIDKRIIFVKYNINKGASCARNTGLDLAKGDFITFVDSDNFIEYNMFEEMINILETNKELDIVCCDAYINEKRRKIYNNSIYIGEKAISAMVNDIIGWSVYTKLYKSSILEDIRFKSQILTGEDLLFSWKVFSQSNIRVKYINEPYYHVINRKNSLGMRRTAENYYSFYWVCRYICRQSKKYRYIEIYKMFYIKFIITSISLFRIIVETKNKRYYKFLNIIKKNIRKNIFIIIKKNISIKINFSAILICMPLKISTFFIKIFSKRKN